jgi:tRNA C32,U32 (ribose-2'-O)-methylase TrmJ
MMGGPLGKDLASPWKEGLGEDLEGYLDEVLDPDKAHFARHDPSSLKDRLRKRMDRGDLTRPEYRKYVGFLERIEE